MQNQPHIIVFTRWPEPGQTKTRLAPALGYEGAASLQAEMTRHTLAQAREAAESASAFVKVLYAGGNKGLMEDWLGKKIRMERQGPGDLGSRMTKACEDAFREGASSVVITGTDCPGADSSIIRRAVEELSSYDSVIGPAEDGGYYLIGLARPAPRIFKDINWSTNQVLEQTEARARELGMSVSKLPTLRDVDRPEDIACWEKVSGKELLQKICVVIPALNEEEALPGTLRSIGDDPKTEVVVADCGSSDATVEKAKEYNATVINAKRGRAAQMNAGARHCSGPLLLFLHADTALPAGYASEIRRIMSKPGVALGAFRLGIRGERMSYRIIEQTVNARCRLFGMPYGDQGLFVKKNVFDRTGGFRDLAIMEDVDFVRRARTYGSFQLASSSASTSARRWKTLGVMRTTVINQLVVAGFFAGISPENLAKFYNARRNGKL